MAYYSSMFQTPKDLHIKYSLEFLQKWLRERHWKLEFDPCGYSVMDVDEKLVSINARKSKENQLYELLHEIGHILIHKGRVPYANYHPISAKADVHNKNKSLRKSKQYKVDVISEEIDAWKRGKKLAKANGLYLDDEKFTKHSYECIFSYVEWAT